MLCGTGCKNVAALEREGQITIKRYQRDHARADFVRVQGDRESVAFWAAKLMQDYPAKGARLVPGTGHRDAVLGVIEQTARVGHRADGALANARPWRFQKHSLAGMRFQKHSQQRGQETWNPGSYQNGAQSQKSTHSQEIGSVHHKEIGTDTRLLKT